MYLMDICTSLGQKGESTEIPGSWIQRDLYYGGLSMCVGLWLIKRREVCMVLPLMRMVIIYIDK